MLYQLISAIAHFVVFASSSTYFYFFTMRCRCAFSFIYFSPAVFLFFQTIPLPDDLLISDLDYGADILALLLDFFMALFLVIVSLLFLRTYRLVNTSFEKFTVVSSLYLLLWEFFFVVFFWYLFDLFYLFPDDSPNLLFNLLLLDNTTRKVFIVFFVLPVFIDVLLTFFYSDVLRFVAFNRLTSLELPIMLGLVYFFASFLLRSFDLFLIYLLLESISFLLVIILALDNLNDSVESAVKYFSISAASGGFYLFGSAWFYGLLGNTDFFTLLNYFYIDDFILNVDLSELVLPFLLLLISFSFKLSVFPGHAWAPDVYIGSGYATIYLISVFLKLVFVFIFIELLTLSFYFIYFWRIFLVFSSFSSAVVSFLGAFRQNNLKRWLAYSTINQIGFVLLGLVAYDSFFGVRAVFFYFLSYLASITILFSIISCAVNSAFGEIVTLNDLVAFCKTNTQQALYVTLTLFSLSGLPPFIGFFGKYFVLLALFDSDLSFFLFFFFLLNAFSVYYYLRLVQVIWANSHYALSSTVIWFAAIDSLDFAPDQQTNLKVFLFLLLPLFLSDAVELVALLSYGDYPSV